MSELNNVVIVAAARTPVGSMLGKLSTVKATELGSVAIRKVIEKSGIKTDIVDEVIMGCVLPAGLGQAPARQAALGAGLPNDVCCMTINKVCGSGLKSVMLGAQAIMIGDADVVIAGGMESMSMAPHLLPSGRTGIKYGNGTLIDHMAYDGLTDAYENGPMGCFADDCATSYKFSREEQDAYAIRSYKLAQESIEHGRFKEEIAPVSIPQRKGEPVVIEQDEEPARVTFDKIPQLRGAFSKDGTVTAANASTINDGAAAILLMSENKAKELGLKPMVRIVAQASAARKPSEFTIAPVDAIKKVLEKAKLKIDDIDLYEINEAFAVVTLAAMKDLNIPQDKVNINGGSVAIGHPIGASGARILTTLLYAMKQKGVKRGLATLCIGGGEASALIVETI
ncbi:MAG: acetyl-CoA C-acetyltransferase [Calditrichaeota bacterium]|nr:acetyl-CoA C-acetyltransferase [Calditrichota bacterium]